MTSDPSILVGRYELGAALGRGGMADVVRARDLRLERDVAVKLLREGGDIDRERFASEARLLAMLSHPNVVTVLDAGVDHDRPWLVLELVDGAPMDEWLVDGPIDATRIAAIGAQVAEALAHAHAHDIAHRDVKPANVLIGSGDRAKLSDFGIARRTNSASLTLTGHTIGTVTYLAPEQVAGESVSTPADVYALGLVLLEALTGHREYDGPPVEAAFARLHRSPTGWPSLISTMTARVPAERPTAAAVAARLTVLADRAPAGTPPAPTAEVPALSKPAARHRRGGFVIAAGAVGGLLLTTAIVVTAVDDDRGAASTPGSTGSGATPRAAPRATPGATAGSPSVTRATASIATTVEPTAAPTPPARHRLGGAKQHPAGPKAKEHKAKGPKPKKHKPPGGKRKHGKKR